MPNPATSVVLQTDSVETTYVRAGSGSPLVLLFPHALDDALAAALFAHLTERFRVVALTIPDVVGTQLSIARWLREVIDGLGLQRPVLVGDEALVGALLGFALVDPGRVGGVVAVCREDADPASSVGMLHAAQGLLVVSVDSCADVAASAREAAIDITRFVDDSASVASRG